MQGIYIHIPEKNYVPREYSVAAILLLLFTVHISRAPVLNVYYYYYYYYYYYHYHYLLQLGFHPAALVLRKYRQK